MTKRNPEEIRRDLREKMLAYRAQGNTDGDLSFAALFSLIDVLSEKGILEFNEFAEQFIIQLDNALNETNK